METLTRLFNWHEDLTYKWVERLQITEYQAMWIAYFKGLITMLFLIWIF